ncbi:alpha,alpha-trehalase TreA [Mucilaginibacter aquatilis]|uniref:Alpha,alpha-trehalase TreA n=1 Tax=Mucilaginibacter aquatilis TaxID=1517760 RepID=A0A6I4IEM3_9SPHI|nr:alpha,alpha-trehalase TreA [Mucilaginibacter aquatilis]MVN92238.1 alpha,alpha-trehalase TreA [Mucilaginibacter aquatilis]
MTKKKFTLLNLIFCLFSSLAFAQHQTPAQLYPQLFDAVQMQQVYSDGKTFVDAQPTRPVVAILKDYRQQKNQPGFNLNAFVKANFKAPVESGIPYKSNVSAGIRKHIDTLWNVLQHVADTAKGTTLIPLPHDYIVPGGRFREIYYWDSYFTMLGLEEAKRFKLIESMVDNFAYLIDKNGHIPNGNRTYYLTRSQPPFFSFMVQLLARHKGNSVLKKYLPQLLKEYAYWMQGAVNLKAGTAAMHVVSMPNGSLLNRYWDASAQPREESYREDVLTARETSQLKDEFYRNIRAAAESGWDFSSRWLADGKSLATIQTTNFAAVDLNCLLYNLENVIAQAYKISNKPQLAAQFNTKAAKRKKAIDKYCWDAKAGCYKDYNWKLKSISSQVTIATAFPLFTGIANSAQASQVAALIKNKFIQPGGIAATLKSTGQQWDQPNGWAPLQYVTIMGLRNYQYYNIAKGAAEKWITLNINVFKQTGKLLEKYDIQHADATAGGGEYPLQDGFGWTNGVLLKLMNLYRYK